MQRPNARLQRKDMRNSYRPATSPWIPTLLVFLTLTADASGSDVDSIEDRAGRQEFRQWIETGGSIVIDRDSPYQSFLYRRNAVEQRTNPLIGNWYQVGPSKFGGRVRALVFDKSDPNFQTLWLGSAGAGIWKSEDYGQSWSIQPNFPSVPVCTIAIPESNPNIIYAGTGEVGATTSVTGGGGITGGIGIFKSTDNGGTWERLESTNPSKDASWSAVMSISVHPSKSSNLLATGFHKVFRSIDGGTTWTPTLSDSLAYHFYHLVRDPFNPQRVFASDGNARVFYSQDDGQSWALTSFNTLGGGDVAIAFAQSTPGLAYAKSFNNTGSFYRSIDGGITWTLVAVHGTGYRAWTNLLWVDPFNSNHIVSGDVALRASFDGGVTFEFASPIGYQINIHPDFNAFAPHPQLTSATAKGTPRNRQMFVANDGGVHLASDIDAADAVNTSIWTHRNNGLEILQFYSIAQGQGVVFGGTQDQGTVAHLGTGEWTRLMGSDGMDTVYTDVPFPTYFSEQQLSLVSRTTSPTPDSMALFCVPNQIASPDFCGVGPFYVPLLSGRSDRSMLIAGGGNSVWFNRNAATSSAWERITASVGGGFNRVTALAVLGDPDTRVIYAQTSAGIRKCVIAANGQCANVNLSLDLMDRVTSIERDTDTNLYLSLGGTGPDHAFRSIDGGYTFTPISSGLPAAPAFFIRVHPTRRSELYLGTTAGLWTSPDKGTNWYPVEGGPDSAAITDIAWENPSTFVVATHGRGAFRFQEGAIGAVRNFRSVGNQVCGGTHVEWDAPSAGIPLNYQVEEICESGQIQGNVFTTNTSAAPYASQACQVGATPPTIAATYRVRACTAQNSCGPWTQPVNAGVSGQCG